MFIVFVSLLAAVAAAPQYLHQSINHGSDYYPGPEFHHGFQPDHHRHYGHHGSRRGFADSFFNDEDIFDTSRFWAELSAELRELDNVLAEFYRRFPTSVSREGVEGNEYKITIPLEGYDEKDIVVKAKQGMLMVQAIHKFDETVIKNYLDVRSLPDCVNVKGSWTYENGVLKIVFPLKDDAVVDENKVVTVAPTFETVTESREEIEPTQSSNIEDADVGLKRDHEETEQEHMLQTNEIPNNDVEATTYAVDIKGDVEFVPVQFKK